MKLSIIIPVYNEKNTILEILKRVEAAKTGLIDKEIILIDDCSTDGTREILKNLPSRFKVLYHEKNLGKGAALRAGFSQSEGDIVLVQDADLEYNPREYPKLIEPILKGEADIVYGSRFVGSEPHRALYFWHSLGNKFLTALSNMFTNLNLTDVETCYKVFKKEVIKSILPKLRSNRFGFEPEVTALVSRGGWRIYEVGITYHGRTYKEGKKINWRDGLAAIWHIIKYNLPR